MQPDPRGGRPIKRVDLCLEPHVERRIGTEEVYRLPERCPLCNTPIVRVPDQAMAYCPNEQCPARNLESVIHYVMVMDMETIGEKLCEQLVEAGYITNVADFYRLTRDQLLALDGVQQKSADNNPEGHRNEQVPPLLVPAVRGSTSAMWA